MPRTPMLYDIAAIQALYGANFKTRNGNDTYEYKDKTRPFMETIWDGGGIDTIDASKQSLPSEINLNTGQFSSIGPLNNTYFFDQEKKDYLRDALGNAIQDPQAKYNLAIAFGVTIENAIRGSGNDILIPNQVGNNLRGGAGSDTASYSASTAGVNVNLATSAASGGYAQGDTLLEIENVEGSKYPDILFGNEKDNVLRGLDGNDFLQGNAGDDTLDGGLGVDTVSYTSSPEGVSLNIGTGSADDGFGFTDSLAGFENIIGSNFNDILIGNASNNEISALNGNDVLVGNAGNDTLDGGSGIDTAGYLDDSSAVSVSLETNTATDGFGGQDILKSIENITGSRFGAHLTGSNRANTIKGDEGADIIEGKGGDDELIGGEGADVYGGTGNDSLNGGEGNDKLFGEDGNDRLEGNADDDELPGGNGADTLYGGTGTDKLSGDTGNDLLLGEAGNDLIDGGTEVDTVSYDNSPSGVVVNIDEAQNYQNSGGSFHTAIVSTSLIPTDTEPNFTINAGTATDDTDTVGETLLNV